MRFTPKSAAQLDAERRERMNVLAVGTYEFTVREVLEQTSRSGNPMLKVTLTVYYEGGEKILVDYILASHQDKLFAFAAALDVEELYHQGDMEPDELEGRNGKVKVGIEQGKPDGKGGLYPDKNKVAFYVAPARKPAAATTAPASTPQPKPAYVPVSEDDDDIPF